MLSLNTQYYPMTRCYQLCTTLTAVDINSAFQAGPKGPTTRTEKASSGTLIRDRCATHLTAAAFGAASRGPFLSLFAFFSCTQKQSVLFLLAGGGEGGTQASKRSKDRHT